MSEEALSKLIYLCSLGCEKSWEKYVKTKDQASSLYGFIKEI